MAGTTHRIKPSYLVLVVLLLHAALSLGLSVGPITYELVTPHERLSAGEEFAVHVDFAAGEGVHVYRDKTKIIWTENIGAEPIGGPALPEARMVPDPLDPLQEVLVYEGRFRITYRFRTVTSTDPRVLLKGMLHFQGCTDSVCYAPAKVPVEFRSPGESVALSSTTRSAAPESTQTPLRASEGDGRSGAGLLINLLWAFGIGFLISLTPCVLPMIPITSAVITGLGKNKSWSSSLLLSLVYVLGLACVYAVAGLAAALLGSQVQSFLNQWYVRLPVAGVFILLALSMFDVIAIQMPQALQNKLLAGRRGSADEDKGRSLPLALAPAFGMGLVAGLVAGPCVAAPLAAVLIHIATVGKWPYGFWMLFIVAWGMSPVLIVAGTLPGLVPKRGMWMVVLKKIFGFVMIWAALYFSKSMIGGPVYHLAVGVLLVFAAVFAGCLDRLTAESGAGARAWHAIGILTLMAAFGLGTFGVVLLTDRPVGRMSPFIPSTEAQVRQAIQSGKPVVIDFWADYCTICKQLDKGMFRDPRVREALNGVLALKVDVEAEPDLAKLYGLVGVPHLTFIGADGNERTDIPNSAPASAEDLIERVESLKSGGRSDSAAPRPSVNS